MNEVRAGSTLETPQGQHHAVRGRAQRVSDFDKMWFGQTVSTLGNTFTAFALPSLALLVLHATTLQIGVLDALATGAATCLALVAGVLADRRSRRNIMIGADLVRFAAMLAIPVTAIWGLLRMELLYALALVTGVASVFFDIAYRSYMPLVVPSERITRANMKLQFSNSAVGMVGGAVAGLLIQTVGAAVAIGVDALSYLVSLVTLVFVRSPHTANESTSMSVTQVWRDVMDGARVILNSSQLLRMVLSSAAANCGGSILGSVLLFFAYRMLDLHAAPLGIVLGCAELGFVGVLFSTRLRNALGLRAAMIATIISISCATAALTLALMWSPYVVFFVVMATISVSLPLYNVNAVSYFQTVVDVGVQGRVQATISTFVGTIAAMGALLGGYLGSRIGVPWTIVLAALCAGSAVLPLVGLRENGGAQP